MISTFLLFLIFLFLYQNLRDCSKGTNFNIYRSHHHFPKDFLGPWKSLSIIKIIISSWYIFSSALADSLSLEFEWQQVCTILLESSQYSFQSQQCCSLDCLHSFSYFQVLRSLYQTFGHCTKSSNYNSYHRHLHVAYFFYFQSKFQVLGEFFTLALADWFSLDFEWQHVSSSLQDSSSSRS